MSMEDSPYFLKQVEAETIKLGDYIIIEQRPCKVTYTRTGAVRHGIRTVIQGTDLITNVKTELRTAPSRYVDIPIVVTKDFLLVGMDADGYLTILLDSGELREDLRLPKEFPELTQKMTEDFDKGMAIVVTVLFTFGQEQVIAYAEQM